MDLECIQTFVTFAGREKILLSSEMGKCKIEQPEKQIQLIFFVNDLDKLEKMLNAITNIFECYTQNVENQDRNEFLCDDDHKIFWKIRSNVNERKIILEQIVNDEGKEIVFTLTEFYFLLKGFSLILISCLPFDKNEEKSFLLLVINEISLNDFESDFISKVLKVIEKIKQENLYFNINSYSILSKVIFYAEYLKTVKQLQLLSSY